MAERSGTPAGRKRLAALNAALLAGLGAGIADGIAVVLENPRSFHGAADVVRFLAAAVALSLGVALPAGALAALGRSSASRVVALGAALFLFAWLGVRVHVRFFFGEPLAAPMQAATMTGILIVSLLVGAAAARALGRPLAAVADRRRTLIVPAAVLLAAAAVSRATAPTGDARPRAVAAGADRPDILLVTLDTTRADHLSCYGYPRSTTPAIDRLARGGRTLRGVWASIPLTNPSHASMFTRLIPRQHGVLNNGTPLPDSVRTHVQGLAAEGYTCAAFVSGIPLKAGLSGLAKGFTVYDDVFSPLERAHPMLTTLALVRVANRVLPLDLVERHAEATCAAAERWLRASDGPRFVWVHLFDPHAPYDAPKPLTRYFRAQGGGWTAHGAPAREWPIADYDAEILRADRALAGLFRTFDEVSRGRGRVLVTADHGEGLGEHGELSHGAQLFAEDVTVPFVVVRPEGGEALGIGRGQSLVNLVGDELVGPAHGYDSRWALIETFAPEGKTDRSAVIGRGTLFRIPADPSSPPVDRSVRSGKLLRNQETGEETAYDLLDDPGERSPIAAPGPEWDPLREILPRSRAARDGTLDPETERKLRALGYIH